MRWKLTIIIILFYLPLDTSAQRWGGGDHKENDFSLSVETSPGFYLNTTAELEEEQVVANAFRLIVTSEDDNVLLYAAIPYGIWNWSSTSMPVSNIRLKLNHTTCPSSYQQYVATSDVIMNNSNSLLFKQKKKNNLTADWYYDVKIPALGYDYAPGYYYYSFLFTMTED